MATDLRYLENFCDKCIIKLAKSGDQDAIDFADMDWLLPKPYAAAPGEWTKFQCWSYETKDAPSYSCRHCKKRGVRVVLESDTDGDDYNVFRYFFYRCSRCEYEWSLRSDRVAPDWLDRQN